MLSQSTALVSGSHVRWGIDSISVNPDAVDVTRRQISPAEQRVMLGAARARDVSSA